MSQAEAGRSGGLGIASVLGIAFVVLKLTDQIDWSWWWVTAPFWVPVVMAVTFMLFVLLVSFVQLYGRVK